MPGIRSSPGRWGWDGIILEGAGAPQGQAPSGRRGAESCQSPPRGDPLPVPTHGRDVAAILGSPAASERSRSPGVPRSPPRPRDEVSVRWGPSMVVPLPRGHLAGTESSKAPRCQERMGVHERSALPEPSCLPRGVCP